MNLLFIVSGAIFFFLLGFISAKLYFKRKKVGKLHIETSDPEGAYLFVELTSSIDYLMTQNDVVLTIDTKNYISHE